LTKAAILIGSSIGGSYSLVLRWKNKDTLYAFVYFGCQGMVNLIKESTMPEKFLIHEKFANYLQEVN
jgi:hypothetical protein